MLNEYQKKLLNEKQKMREFNRLERETIGLKTELDKLADKENAYKRKLNQEQVDVEKLEGLSITGIFITLAGKKLERLDKEKREVVAAQLKWQEASEARQDVEKELADLAERMNRLGNPKEKYDEFLRQKQEYLLTTSHEDGERSFELLNKIADLNADSKEINEALDAGSLASKSLSDARESLNKAKNWGTLDMFGGGLISTSLKHSNMDTAREEVHRAQKLLRKFSYELEDIGHTFQVDLSISGGLTFMDYFLMD
ncbi:hypothetical protein GH741_16100 [Aquibacillus halophilus]|uniref:Uncharacterized protein n=1 Tax=Aquibacillus halophilus TaxID=930132 RepID=A0A6A8DEP5_9BACI|nr:hypothetical protein [Aquibacillus halophilus]MRH44165.1 hypothetical protein [Aquibacillus halophilus]